jgi:uncharacterized RDD family membrane protein YckC
MRWRDVKHGKIVPKKGKEKSLPPFTISPILDRFKAFIIDTFMIMMPIMYCVFYIIMGSREVFSEHMVQGWLYIFVPHCMVILTFYKLKSQTPGYKAYNIKLVDTNLQKPTILQLFIRYITFALSVFLVTGIILGFIRKDRKNLHDILSGTMPIKIES